MEKLQSQRIRECRQFTHSTARIATTFADRRPGTPQECRAMQRLIE